MEKLFDPRPGAINYRTEIELERKIKFMPVDDHIEDDEIQAILRKIKFMPVDDHIEDIHDEIQAILINAQGLFLREYAPKENVHKGYALKIQSLALEMVEDLGFDDLTYFRNDYQISQNAAIDEPSLTQKQMKRLLEP